MVATLATSEMANDSTRYKPIATRIEGMAGWPLPITVVVTPMSSANATATPRDVFLVRFRHWLMIGGMAMRKAWGSTTWRRRCPAVRPMAPAASVCPRGTARIDPRTISATCEEV